MRAKINITINLPDEFKLGSCKGCPYCFTISEYKFSSQSYIQTEKCLLEFDKVTCPIEIVEEVPYTKFADTWAPGGCVDEE